MAAEPDPWRLTDFARSHTSLSERTLDAYRFLEHGAFYAIIALAVVMYVQTLAHVPEVITGLFGATLIGVSLWSSIRWNRRHGPTDG